MLSQKEIGRQRGLTTKKLLSFVLAVLAFSMGLATMGAAPATASTPQCTSQSQIPMFSDVADRAYKVWMPAYSGQIDCWLAIRSNSSAVKALQSSLRACNGQNIAVDGSYGPATQQAVRNVQTRWNSTHSTKILVDGVYGSQTRHAMLWYGYNPLLGYLCQYEQDKGGR